MTSVVRMQFHSLGNQSADGRRGINAGALAALSRHNIRDKIDYAIEMRKGKKATHIDTSLSNQNICYRQLDFDEIKTIKQQKKQTGAKNNAVGSFELVFDFTENVHTFDASAHNEMVMGFLKEIGLLERFKLLEMVLHLDEEREKPHFHIVFSGFNQELGKFAVNDFFSPKGEQKILRDKNGDILYKKVKNGKHRGEFELDAYGAKIPMMEAYRRNGAQWLQDSYAQYLIDNDFKYSNKKKWSSALQFPNGIWRKFDQATKNAVYYFRDLENLYYEEKSNGASQKDLQKIEEEMANGLLGIHSIVRVIKESPKPAKNLNNNI